VFLGINGSEFIVLLVVAAVVLGPERLPQYAAQLGRLVRELRRMAQGASQQMREELGPEFDDIDWRKLDPRQYDPRRIVREALADNDLDPDDPLGLRGTGVDRRSLGLDREGLGLDRESLRSEKPVSPGGPASRVTTANSGNGANGANSANSHAAGTPSGAGTSGGAADEIPLDPDAT
jgi:sec-independent protein translocase protein TatB